MSDKKNPYAQAAGAYSSAVAETDQRALEGQVLMKAAQMLEDLSKRLQSGEKVPLEEIGNILDHNSKLWQLFVDGVKDESSSLPNDIKSNILSLALFVFKRTNEIYIDTTPEKFTALININRNIAAGLMKRTASASPKTETSGRKEFQTSDI